MMCEEKQYQAKQSSQLTAADIIGRQTRREKGEKIWPEASAIRAKTTRRGILTSQLTAEQLSFLPVQTGNRRKTNRVSG